MARPIIDNQRARRLFLDHHGLVETKGGSGRASDLAGVIHDLGFVQVDSVNTLARAHDLILWARRGQYRPAALGGLLQNDRAVFEHWTHDASVIPIQFFKHWRHRFESDRQRLKSRWQEWRRDGFLEKIDGVLAQIQRDGECTSGTVGADEERKSGGWWDWHPSKTALEFLWRTGQVSVSRRVGFQKVYDLTERVIPEEHLTPRTTRPESVDWACSAAIDRLGFATHTEISNFFELATKEEAREWVQRALASQRLVEVEVELTDGQKRHSFVRPETLSVDMPEPSSRVRVLSPFDPALRDRQRAERLFGYNYRIEIFVPAAKRKYGYYVFPVMEGDRLIGRIDMKANRPESAIDIQAFWSEPGVRMGKGRIARLMSELERMGRFSGCPGLRFKANWMRDPI